MMRVALRSGWVKFGLVAVLMAGGAAGGFYLSRSDIVECVLPPDDDPPTRTPVEKPSDGSPPSFSHRFALTLLDAKDTIEAPELAIDVQQRVWLAWGSKTGDKERTVFVARSTDRGQSFTPPQDISKGGIFRTKSKGQREGYERRATPHLAAAIGQLFLSWSQADADGGRLRLLIAEAGGAELAFGAPRPVDQGAGANPCFTAMSVGPDGALACAWLGGPDGQQPFAAIRPAGATAFERERLVYAGEDGKGVCPCCPVAVCIAADGTLYVAFRNIADGYRDIAVSVLKPGQAKFEGPWPVVPPRWKFNGCPHDGPSLAIVGDQLHVAWMDASTGAHRCYHAHARRSDLAFSAHELHPIPVGTQGNAKLCVDQAGKLHAVWEESATASAPSDKHQHGPPKVTPGDPGRAIMHAVLGADGRIGNVRAVNPRGGAFQTRPAIAVTSAGQVIVAYNELDEAGKSIVVASLDVVKQ